MKINKENIAEFVVNLFAIGVAVLLMGTVCTLAYGLFKAIF